MLLEHINIPELGAMENPMEKGLKPSKENLNSKEAI
jgi:hypothetical protein